MVHWSFLNLLWKAQHSASQGNKNILKYLQISSTSVNKFIVYSPPKNILLIIKVKTVFSPVYFETVHTFLSCFVYLRYCIENRGKVQIVFLFGRNQFNFFLSVCLPTFLANAMGHLTNYFPNFDTAVAVNLTLLLVISNM